MKDKELSMPEKKSRKTKCTALRRKCEFVLSTGFAGLLFFPFALADLPVNAGSVSGRQKYRYTVSTTMSARLKPAAVAKGFAATVEMVLSQAPRPGPKVKAIEKHAPMMAIVEPREASSEISVAMAVASWTLPSERPPTTRLAMKVRKSTAA